MTIRDAITDYLEDNGHPDWADIIRADRWISVEERLPEPGLCVMIYLANYCGPAAYDYGRWTNEENDPCWYSYTDGYLDDGSVSHWRLMPEFPEIPPAPAPMTHHVQPGQPITAALINEIAAGADQASRNSAPDSPKTI